MVERIELHKFWLFLATTLLVTVAIAVGASVSSLQDVTAQEPGLLEQVPSASTGAAPVSLRRSPSSAEGIEGIAGSTVTTADCYEPDTAQILCFTVTNSSTDAEWLNRVRLTFPDYGGLGPWIVGCNMQDTTDSSGATVSFSCSASGNEVVYEDSDNASDQGTGEITSGSTWSFCVDVAIPSGYNGARYVQWGLRGDGDGAIPHEVFGSTEVEMCAPLMLRPGSQVAEGCNGIPHAHTFEIWNNTGSSGTFDLTYSVSSGNGMLSGPSGFRILDGEIVTFTAVLTPDLCLGSGDQVLATLHVSGNGHSDTSSIIETIGDFLGWEKRADSPVATMDNAVAWAVKDGGLWSVGGYGSKGATQRYDPETDTWTLHTPESSITPTIEYPADGCYGLDADDHEVIVLFPDAVSPVTTTLHRYDITADEWDAPLRPAGFPSDGLWSMDITSLYNVTGKNVCYLSGGATQEGGGNVNNLWAYYPITNTTIYLGNFTHHPAGFNFHASWYVPWIGTAGAICVGGGTDSQGAIIGDTQCYDLATGTFNPPNADLGPLPEPWWGMADGWKIHNGRHQIWIANGVKNDWSLIGATAYADDSTGGFVYGPPPLAQLYRLEGDGWFGHFYTEQGAAGGFTYSTDQERLVQCPECLEWSKQVNGESWFPDITVMSEISDTIEVVDVFTTNQPLDLFETWNPDELALINWVTQPSSGSVLTGTGSLIWSVPPGGFQVITMTKLFHVEPCTWTQTILTETLGSQQQELETRLVPIQKLPADLWIQSNYDPAAYAGESAFFSLEYGNAGGYENSVSITNTFPTIAPFVWAEPWPDEVDPGGESVMWEVGDLAGGDMGTILVEVSLDSELPPGTLVPIWDGIYNHAGELQDETTVEFEVAPPSGVHWEKTINSIPWYPDMSLSVETFGVVAVVDRIEAGPDLDVLVIESWDPELLALEEIVVGGGEIEEPVPGQLVWHLPPGTPSAAITKTFRVLDCAWELVEIWEELQVNGIPEEFRPIIVFKDQPNLWIESSYDPDVVAGRVSTFTLLYGNDGGYESGAWIENEFPPEALFEASIPPPDAQDPAGLWARWNVGELARGEQRSIEVAVLIEPTLPISTPISIWDGIFSHADIIHDEVFTDLHVVPPPPPEWAKWVNGQLWHPELVVSQETSGTIEIVDVFVAEYAFNIFEAWDPAKLALSQVRIEPDFGVLHQDDGWLEWTVPPPEGPTVFTMTKELHVEPCIWESTLVHEILSVADQVVDERPLFVVKDQPHLWIDSLYEPLVSAGRAFTYTLDYGNLGGYESGSWIEGGFPAEAPFHSSEPAPDWVSQDRLNVLWDTGILERNQSGQIQVSVAITSTVSPFSTISVWDGIRNHGGGLEDEIWSHLFVRAHIYLPLILRDYSP